MMRFILAMFLASCATAPSDPCDLVDGGNYCPRAGNQHCKLERLRREFSACTLDEDCEVLPLINSGNCIGYSSCPRKSVAVGQVEPFLTAANASLKAHCAEVLCRQSGSCLQLYETAVCDRGFCQTKFTFEPPDAGSTDAG